MKRSHTFLTALALLAFASCKKENQSGVPPVALDITLNINLPEYADLQVPGGWVYLTGGSSALRPFQQTQRAAFPGVQVIEGDLFGGVASGLAYSRG